MFKAIFVVLKESNYIAFMQTIANKTLFIINPLQKYVHFIEANQIKTQL